MTNHDEAALMLIDGINGIVEAIPCIIEMATAKERAAVVAFLRLHINDENAAMYAAWIECGEHRTEKP